MSKKRQSDRMGAVRTLSYDYPDGHFIRPHAHDRHQLIYATSGVMTVETPEGAWVVPAHRGVWIPARATHSIKIAGTVSMRTLYIATQVSPSLPAQCHIVAISPLLRELILHAASLAVLDRRIRAHANLVAVLLDQLQVIPGSSLTLIQPRDPRALRLAQHLEAHPGEHRAIEGFLRKAGASRRTLERIFRAETGMTLGRWRQQLRLTHALRLLATDHPITTVALEVGYDSPSAFISAFRSAFGTTPGRYFAGA